MIFNDRNNPNTSLMIMNAVSSRLGLNIGGMRKKSPAIMLSSTNIHDPIFVQETSMSNQVAVLLFALFPTTALAGIGQIPDLESLTLVAVAAFTALVIYHRAK
ncbi:MAG: hypothetical protein JNL84_12810 [Candidatus Accumulibacter sp.]|nr:hypothetical protein [Accumulibacter sp.]